MRSGVEVLVDWLTFTVKDATDPDDVARDWLGMDPALFEDQPFGLFGYQSSKVFSGILICYEPREDARFQDMGVCVSMSGHGCRTFETFTHLAAGRSQTADNGMQDVSDGFLALFRAIVSAENAHTTRLDISCDEHQGFLDMAEIEHCLDDGCINSRMRSFDTHKSHKGRKAPPERTVYIGAPSSDFRVRIYDKAMQQKVDGHWVRVELVMRKEHSNSFLEQLITTETAAGELAAQVLNEKLAFIYEDDVNISRCTVRPWWSGFLDTLKAVQLVAREVVQQPVEAIEAWVRRSVAPSLAVLVRTMGSLCVGDIIREGEERLSSRQELLIREYRVFASEQRLSTYESRLSFLLEEASKPITPAFSPVLFGGNEVWAYARNNDTGCSNVVWWVDDESFRKGIHGADKEAAKKEMERKRQAAYAYIGLENQWRREHPESPLTVWVPRGEGLGSDLVDNKEAQQRFEEWAARKMKDMSFAVET